VRVLLDTTILVDYFRDLAPAVTFIEALDEPPLLSTINVAELYAGVRDGDERQRLDGALAVFRALDVTVEIAREGGLLRRRWGPSHGVGLADALIAATAQAHALGVVTRNRKHFPMLDDIITPY
jgi:predicted nucleic acid-binding protein